jgi:hypothetical protein
LIVSLTWACKSRVLYRARLLNLGTRNKAGLYHDVHDVFNELLKNRRYEVSFCNSFLPVRRFFPMRNVRADYSSAAIRLASWRMPVPVHRMSIALSSFPAASTSAFALHHSGAPVFF